MTQKQKKKFNVADYDQQELENLIAKEIHKMKHTNARNKKIRTILSVVAWSAMTLLISACLLSACYGGISLISSAWHDGAQ